VIKNLSVCALIAATWILLPAGVSAEGQSQIPPGSYAISKEVCDLDSSATDSMADFRSRFGSDALLDVDETQLTFAAIPAFCEMSKTKGVGSALQILAECSVSGNTEDVSFSVIVQPTELAISVLKATEDGWFTADFKKTYILCKKESQNEVH
jgi:hypothetical protein